MEMASHGYIVFALDHHDGSCPYTENMAGDKNWTYDVDGPFIDYNDVNRKINIRVQEMKSLIDDITTENFAKKALKFDGI